MAERRIQEPMKITLRADSVEIEGYVNAVGRDSRTLTDEYGYPYVEQMQPGVFARAIAVAAERSTPIKMLHNHNAAREIGDNATNLTLEEDTIGLHAQAVVTDPEVIDLARNRQLTGWSFGFRSLDKKEDYSSSGKRVIQTEIELVEVSIIDDTMTPVYAGTSVHARADGKEEQLLTRAVGGEAIYTVVDRAELSKPPVDYSRYDTVINSLKGVRK